MTTEKLMSLLSFEQPELLSANIISETELKDDATLIVADLSCRTGVLRVPFIHYQGEDFIFTPYDWQDPSLETVTAADIEDIEWRVSNTNKMVIMLDGLPRIF